MKHCVYDFIDRMESKGLLPLSSGNMRPFSRAEIAEIVSPLVSDMELMGKLTDTEKGELKRFTVEFKEELRAIGITVADGGTRNSFLGRLKDGDPLLSFKEGESEVKFRPTLRVRFVSEKDDWTYQRTAGGTLWGNLKGSLHFYIDPEDTRERGSVRH